MMEREDSCIFVTAADLDLTGEDVLQYQPRWAISSLKALARPGSLCPIRSCRSGCEATRRGGTCPRDDSRAAAERHSP